MPVLQSEGAPTGTVQKHRPEIPADLLVAAIAGNSDVFVRCLGLPEGERNLLEVKIEASHPTDLQLPVEEDVVAEYKLDSATQFGETVLHLLVAKSHNELALKVFESDKSLLKARNNNLETPLHYAAKVGNEEAIHNLIRLDSNVVKDALREANNKGDTALHVAAMHGHGIICCELMKLDRQMACQVNKQGFSALYIAIIEGHTSAAIAMLQVDPALACFQFSDGMFPVLVAAKMGNIELVKHFITNNPSNINFLDPCGRNIYHMAAEQENRDLIIELSKALNGEGVKNMINATDYQGNTPLHIAALNGHRKVAKALWIRMPGDACGARNKKGQTAFALSVIQVQRSSAKKDIQIRIDKYIEDEGEVFSEKWFKKLMKPWYDSDPNKWDRAQIIGLGSVLITTVAFAAAFTIPGGYNQNDGTPILGRRYVYKAFTLANTLSFMQAFVSLSVLVLGALADPDAVDIRYATDTFIAAAGCMVMAFGLGSYVILAPISKGIAILVLVLVVPMGSPFMPLAIKMNKWSYKLFIADFCGLQTIAFQNMFSLLLYIFLFALI